MLKGTCSTGRKRRPTSDSTSSRSLGTLRSSTPSTEGTGRCLCNETTLLELRNGKSRFRNHSIVSAIIAVKRQQIGTKTRREVLALRTSGHTPYRDRKRPQRLRANIYCAGSLPLIGSRIPFQIPGRTWSKSSRKSASSCPSEACTWS